MSTLKSIFTSKYILWLVLAIPGVMSLINYLKGQMDYSMAMHITGEFAGRWLAVSLMATPLILMFPKGRFTRWLLRNRRFFGVSAFAYTLLHTVFYALQYPMTQLISEFPELGILTGWLAFFIFIPLAATSTNAAIKRMGARWKKLQRWVYVAAVMAFAHWALLGLQGDHASMGGALFHFVPVMVLQVYRLWRVLRK